MLIPSNSSRDFIHSVMCNKEEGKTYYEKTCFDGTCSMCGKMALLRQCIHESEDQNFGKMMVDMKSFKYITYDAGFGKERKKM